MSGLPLGGLVLVGGLVGGAGLVAGQALTARTLLGLRVSATRTFVAGAIGWIAFGLVSRRLHDAAEWWLLLSAMLGISVLVTMGSLVVGEALFPSGGRPLRELRRRLIRGRRYSEITAIAVRHGLRSYFEGRGEAGDGSQSRGPLARSLRLALEDGGVTFVKLGQVLSTRQDLLPGELIDELRRLQEQVGPVPWPEVEAVLEEELGSPESIFESFDREPLAAASIAQVHAARLRSGEEVVVKVQRPGIAPVVERDLEVLLRFAATIEARSRRGLSVHDTIDATGAAGVNVAELVHGFAVAIREELDFRVEARNIATVRAALKQRGADPFVHVPAVHEALSTHRVLVMERLHGLSLRAAEPTRDAHGVDRHALAVALLNELLHQIMSDGVFHADPHPGNVLLLEDKRLGLLDFGSVGRVDTLVQGALARLLVAVERRDPAGLRDALLELAQRPDDIDERRLTRDLGRFAARHLNPGTPPDVTMFIELFGLVAATGLTVPAEAAAAFRTLVTLQGTLLELDPSFDVVAEARTFAQTQLMSDLPRVARQELSALLPVLSRLPQRVDRITDALEQGRLNLNVRLLADERDRRVITALLHQTLLAFIAAATGLMSVLLLAANNGPLLSSEVPLYQVLGYNLLLLSLLLIFRVLVVIIRPERPR